MAYGSRFVERDMRRMVEELEEERARTDAAGAGAEHTASCRCTTSTSATARCRSSSTSTSRYGAAETLAVLGTNGAGKSTLLRGDQRARAA